MKEVLGFLSPTMRLSLRACNRQGISRRREGVGMLIGSVRNVGIVPTKLFQEAYAGFLWLRMNLGSG
jgi:hypothetical protein